MNHAITVFDRNPPVWSYWPFRRRCRAAQQPPFGERVQCDRVRGHDGRHAVERGAEIWWWE